MDELEHQLRLLAQKTCTCAHGSPERQRCFDRLIQQIQQSGKLWRRSGIPEPDYQDILQKTWQYLYLNLCEATTARQPYQPSRASLTTWINAYLKMRILDYFLEQEQEKQRRQFPILSSEGELLDPIDLLPAPTEPPPILLEIWAWLEREGTTLRRIHLRDRADIHCQVLIQRRLPPETTWQELSQEFKVSITTLQGFYQKQCLPRLREAGKKLGYL